MSSSASILVFGRDEILARTRALVLARQGYRVVTIRDTCEIDRIATLDRIDLLVLCHTLTIVDSIRALEISRANWPKIKSLALVAGRPASRSIDVDIFLYAMEGPEKLLDTICRLVGSCNHSTTAQAENVA